MKYKIISFSDLDINCWSAMRYLDSCEDCIQIRYPPFCKLPEGIRGKIKFLDNKISEAKEEIKKLRKEQHALKTKLQ